MARSNVFVAVNTFAVLVFGASCAGKEAGQQEPISENLAPAVASPSTEAYAPLPRTSASGFQSDWASAEETAGTAPLYESRDEGAAEARTNREGERETVHTFVPKVQRQSAATITTVPNPATETTTAMTGLTDGQIVKIAETMQNAELAEARIVRERAQDARVKQFAEQLQQDNTRLKNKTEALAKSEQLVPTESPIAADIRVKASQELTSVELAQPAEFDKAFIDAQVQENEEMLQLLNARLIPGATEPKLKAELTQSKAILERQGEDAKRLQRTLEAAPR